MNKSDKLFECKTLRVKLDQHLSSKSKTENICKNAIKSLLFIGSNHSLIKTHFFIYNAFVFSYTNFDYCCEVWGVFGKNQ